MEINQLDSIYIRDNSLEGGFYNTKNRERPSVKPIRSLPGKYNQVEGDFIFGDTGNQTRNIAVLGTLDVVKASKFAHVVVFKSGKEYIVVKYYSENPENFTATYYSPDSGGNEYEDGERNFAPYVCPAFSLSLLEQQSTIIEQLCEIVAKYEPKSNIVVESKNKANSIRESFLKEME